MLPHIPRRAGQPPTPPQSEEGLASCADARGGGAVLTEAGSPLPLPLPQIRASLSAGGSQRHRQQFLEGRARTCPLLGPPSSALSLSVHLSVYEHSFPCTYRACVWVQTEVFEPNPKDRVSPALAYLFIP